MDFLDKIRKKPENERKMILWIIIIVVGLIFILLWIYTSQKSIRELEKEDIMEQINLPAKENLPQIEGPSEEDLKELEDLMNQLKQENAE